MRPGQPDAGVVDGQHRSMSPVHGGRPDRIGSLFDAACPTAVTPDTGFDRTLTVSERESVAGEIRRPPPPGGRPRSSAACAEVWSTSDIVAPCSIRVCSPASWCSAGFDLDAGSAHAHFWLLSDDARVTTPALHPAAVRLPVSHGRLRLQSTPPSTGGDTCTPVAAPLVPLAKAREQALANRMLARSGGDPLSEKRRVQGVPTFAEAAGHVLEQKRGGWRGRWHAQTGGGAWNGTSSRASATGPCPSRGHRRPRDESGRACAEPASKASAPRGAEAARSGIP